MGVTGIELACLAAGLLFAVPWPFSSLVSRLVISIFVSHAKVWVPLVKSWTNQMVLQVAVSSSPASLVVASDGSICPVIASPVAMQTVAAAQMAVQLAKVLQLARQRPRRQ
jgi:hypothetical protein